MVSAAVAAHLHRAVPVPGGDRAHRAVVLLDRGDRHGRWPKRTRDRPPVEGDFVGGDRADHRCGGPDSTGYCAWIHSRKMLGGHATGSIRRSLALAGLNEPTVADERPPLRRTGGLSERIRCTARAGCRSASARICVDAPMALGCDGETARGSHPSPTSMASSIMTTGYTTF